ncbi:unnamed protein product, partial [Iphiclides podalirius]
MDKADPARHGGLIKLTRSAVLTSACCGARLRRVALHSTSRVAPNRREPRSRMRPPKTPRAVRMQKIRTRRVGDALRLSETCAYVQRSTVKKSKVSARCQKKTHAEWRRKNDDGYRCPCPPPPPPPLDDACATLCTRPAEYQRGRGVLTWPATQRRTRGIEEVGPEELSTLVRKSGGGAAAAVRKRGPPVNSPAASPGPHPPPGYPLNRTSYRRPPRHPVAL